MRLVVMTLAVLLFSCGKAPEPKSNVNESDKQAQEQLQVRLQKTEEVRNRINIVRRSIEPIENFLVDIGKAINTDVIVNGRPLGHIQNILIVIQKVLKELTAGLVRFEPDGSWVLERHLDLPTLFGNNYQCKSTDIRVVGRRVLGAEQLVISVKGCKTLVYHRLLVAQVRNSRMEVSLHPEALLHIVFRDLKAEQCELTIEDSDVEFRCKPIEVHADNYRARLHPLEFIKNRRGTTATVQLVVRKPNQDLIVDARLEALPGRPVRLTIKTP